MCADLIRYVPILLLVANPVVAADGTTDRTEDIEAIYGAEETGGEQVLSLATGYSQPLVRAPAIATVITAREIEKLGSTTVADVLKTVPGLHVSTARGLNDIFVMRGFFDEFNSYMLLLVNGIPVNNVVNGGRPQAWRMPVHDIARIEIMRGPGSALYGADAAAGVINIITKTAREIGGVEMGAYGGSFQTGGAWLQGGGRWGDLEAAFSLEASATEGYRKTVRADDQTRIDGLLGTRASLAPGPINTRRDDLDARLDLKGERWRFRAGYQGFLDVGTGTGIVLALDPEGDFSTGLTNADFTYDLAKGGQWEVAAQISYLGTTTEASLNPFPPGAFGGLFREGVRDDFRFRVDEMRGGATALYGGIPDHRLRFGMGVSYAKLSDVEESRNFRFGPNGIPVPAPYSDAVESGQSPLLAEHGRRVWYGFAQDEWWFAPDWTLTAGVRLDDYSDFGTAINPRLALVWNPSPSLTAKVVYGRAFRAPNFTELYGNNLLAVSGNPALDPEILNVIEFSLAKQWTSRLWTNVILYGYDLDSQIKGGPKSGTPSDPQGRIQKTNLSGRRGYGAELEAEYQPTRDLRLSASYAYYSSEGEPVDDLGRFAPEHQIYGALDWRLANEWTLNAYLKWIGDRDYGSLGQTFESDGYTLAGASLRRADPRGRIFSVTVDNLFDADATEPATPTALPYGIPLPGRRIVAQFGWRFQ